MSHSNHTDHVEFMFIGHVCHDVSKRGYLLGGSVSYCGLLAQKLAKKTGIITSHGPEFLFTKQFAQSKYYCIPSDHTTVFQNKYEGGIRVQYVLQRASQIHYDDIVNLPIKPEIVLICPIINEVDYEVLDNYLNQAFVAVAAQGWMRRWNQGDKINYQPLDWNKLSDIDMIFLSREDIVGFDSKIEQIRKSVKKVILTADEDGAYFFEGNHSLHFPSYPTKVVDQTGAGDTFTAAFLIKYSENSDVREAMVYGHCAASLCIESRGINFLDNIHLLEERVNEYKIKYANN